MKIKDEYVLENIADRWVVVDTNSRSVNFNNVLSLNESARFLWEKLEKGSSVAELTAALVEEFGISTDLAENDASMFVSELQKYGCIYDEE